MMSPGVWTAMQGPGLQRRRCRDQSLWGRKGVASTEHGVPTLSQVWALDSHSTSLSFSLLICRDGGWSRTWCQV